MRSLAGTAGVYLLALCLLSPPTFAQSYETGRVAEVGATKPGGDWEFHYFVRVDDHTVYEITRHKGRMELKAQQTVQFRLEKNHMYIVGTDGKEARFDIVHQK